MLISGLLVGPISQANPGSAPQILAAPGWSYQATSERSLLRSHPKEVGLLQETKTPSLFMTAPVVVIHAKDLSNRTGSAQINRLEAELKAFAARHRLEKNKPSFMNKKIIEGVPTIETEYGGNRWIFVGTHHDHVVIISAEARDEKPPASARDEFFKMARDVLANMVTKRE